MEPRVEIFQPLLPLRKQSAGGRVGYTVTVGKIYLAQKHMEVGGEGVSGIRGSLRKP